MKPPAVDLPASIEEAGAALRERRLSCVDLARASLERIAALQPSLNAFLTVTADVALAAAAQLDRELRAGADRGPLHGIPLAYKDCFDTAGVRTTVGSRYFGERVPDADAVVVQRLAAAGAVMVGKTNMNEFAAGTSGKNAFYGDVRNPWALERSPGGSSSGTAAAVAAGMVRAGLGTDAGGSIRLPAACTGIVGLRPTLGRVSTHGVFPRAFALDAAGPLAGGVRDCALLLQAIADPPTEDYLAGIEAGTGGLRVGVVRDFSLHELDGPIGQSLERALAHLASLGASVREVRVPALAASPGSTAFFDILLFEFHRILGDAFAASPEPERVFGPVVCDNLRRGAQIGEAAYRGALAEREALAAALRAALTEVEVLVTPAMPGPTPRLDAPPEHFDAQRRFMTPISLAGLPALVLPCGTAQGLPLGMQLVADRGREALVFRLGRAYEATTEWHTRRPKSHSTGEDPT